MKSTTENRKKYKDCVCVQTPVDVPHPNPTNRSFIQIIPAPVIIL